MARVKAIELYTTNGETARALALAITEAEVARITTYKKTKDTAASTPRGFFDPKVAASPARASPRGIEAQVPTMVLASAA